MEICNKLPIFLLNIILEYSGIIKNRNGKYMNQIINYEKYDTIKKIMQIKYKTIKEMIILNNSFYSDLFFSKNSIGIIHDYDFWENGYIIYIYKDVYHYFFNKWKFFFFKFFGFNIVKQEYSWTFQNVFGVEFSNNYYIYKKYEYK
jgi:hypothetical protein